jgi:hypothetical protein
MKRWKSIFDQGCARFNHECLYNEDFSTCGMWFISVKTRSYTAGVRASEMNLTEDFMMDRGIIVLLGNGVIY